MSVPKSGLSHFPRCKTRRGGVARPCTLFTSRLHTRPHSVTIRFASGSLAIGRTVASATATASDPPQAAIAAALLWELNALPFDHDTTTPLPRPASTKVAQIGSISACTPKRCNPKTQAGIRTNLHPARERALDLRTAASSCSWSRRPCLLLFLDCRRKFGFFPSWDACPLVGRPTPPPSGSVGRPSTPLCTSYEFLLLCEQ